MPDRRTIPNDHQFLLAEFQRLYPSLFERGKAVLVIKFLNRLSLRGEHTYEEMRDETIKYTRRLDEALLGEGPLDGWTGDLLTGANIGINLFSANPVLKIAAEVATDVMEFSFVQNWNSDHKALSAARIRQHVVAQGRLLSDALQTLHESCVRGDQKCARVAVDAFPDVARRAGTEGEPAIAVTPAEIVEFFEDDLVLVYTGPRLQAAERRSDGGLEVDLDELRAGLAADFQKLTAGVREASAEVRAELSVMRSQQETVLSWVSAQKAADEKRRQTEKEIQRRREIIDAAAPVIQDAKTGLGVVVALMGVADPKLAKEIATVGAAVINVAETGVQLVQTAITLSKGIGAVLSLGTAAATGNFIAAAGALIGLFMGSGPSPEEMILEEIKALREDMRNFQKDVNERFNRIDEALDRIYTDVMKQLDKIDVSLGKLNGNVNHVLAILAEQSQALERIDRNMSDYFQAAGRADLQEAMGAALLRPSRSKNPQMSEDDYQQYEGIFFNWAVKTSRSAIEAPVANRLTDDVSLHTVLSDQSELADNFALIVKVIRDREWQAVTSDGSGSPNPRTWMIAASAFSQLEAEWPRLAVRFNNKDLNGRRNQVREVGEHLSSVLQSITNGTTADGPTVLELACNALESRSRELGAAFEQEANSWEAEQRYAASQENRPYMPVWRPRDPEPGFSYLPTVPSDIPAEIPRRVVQRIPELYRAAAFLKPDEHLLRAAPDFTGTTPKTITLPNPNGKPTSIKVHFATVRLIVRFRNYPILSYVVGEIPFPKFTPAADVAQTVLLPEWWRTHFNSLKVDAPGMASAEAEEAARLYLYDGCAAACNRSLFPELASSCIDRTQRGGRLWEAASNYGGARALLVSLFSLAMPVERKQHDWLRALFDGSANPNGGIALPSVPQIAALLPAGPEPARADERPLESFVSGMVAEPLELLRQFLRSRRDAPANVSPVSDPALAEALLRLDVSQGIVRAESEIGTN